MNTSAIQVANHGQVARMTLPAGWVERALERSEFDLRSVRIFNPVDGEKTMICLFFRGRPISPRSGNAFGLLLEMPAHDLSEEECDQVQEVFREAGSAEVFQKRRAYTKNWQGRTALVLEGLYPQSQIEMISLFVAGDTAGQIVQEVIFMAPQPEYAGQLTTVLESLESIEWKEAPRHEPARPEDSDPTGWMTPAADALTLARAAEERRRNSPEEALRQQFGSTAFPPENGPPS